MGKKNTKAVQQNDADNAVIVLGVVLGNEPDFDLEETCMLAQAAGYRVVETITAKLRTPDKRLFIGSGKLKELISGISYHKANALIVNRTITSGQHSRLREAIGIELLDYSGLILDIFSQRAKSAASKLQIELAQEIYGSSKLKGAWNHLERQRGGLGATGGPGERQLELDRRLVAGKIKRLRKKLEKIASHTKLTGTARSKQTFSVALVGYTNAGKSTLFQQLSGEKVASSPRLFETLATTTRKMSLGGMVPSGSVVISDTIGFVRNLPHELIEAFNSTLLEAMQADMLAVVVDASDRAVEEKLEVIFNTLGTIGASEIPCLLVWNKVDLNPVLNSRRHMLKRWDKITKVVEVSALKGTGLEELRIEFLAKYHEYLQELNQAERIATTAH